MDETVLAVEFPEGRDAAIPALARAGIVPIRLLTPAERAAHPEYVAVIPLDTGEVLWLGARFLAEWEAESTALTGRGNGYGEG